MISLLVLSSSWMINVFGATAVENRLAALVEEIEAARQSEADSRVIRRLPPFLELGPSLARGSRFVLPAGDALEGDVRSALRAYVEHSGKPRPLALALMWLASARDPGDLALVAGFLDRTEPAGSLPIVHVGQRIQPSYPVEWIDVTIGDVALECVNLITGQRFATADEYPRWKRDHPDLERSFDYWLGILKASASEERKSRLAGIRAKDQGLFLKLVLTEVDVNRYFDWPEDDVLHTFASTISTQRALDLLRESSAWREFADVLRHIELASWILKHHRVTLRDRCDDLALLWPKRSTLRPEIHGWLARAVAECRPAMSRQVLSAAIDESPTPEVVEELALRHLGDEEDRIVRAFFRSEASSTVRTTILGALRTQGEIGKRVLARIVRDKNFTPEDPLVIRELVATAVALGAPDDFPHRGEIFGHQKLPADELKKRQARAARARKHCLDRVRRWLNH